MLDRMMNKPAKDWTMEEYKYHLSWADWSYEYTDCGEVWQRAKLYFKKLEEVSAVLDPDKVVWRQHDRTPGFEA